MKLALIVVFVVTLGPTVLSQDGQPQFTDRAVAAGVSYQHHTQTVYPYDDYTSGGAVGDFDRDGWQDLFAVSGGATADRLFMNDHDGTFTDEAAAWGITIPHLGKAATVGDFNDDGWLDIYETSAGNVGSVAPGRHKLYRNAGGQGFTNVAVSAGVNFSHPTTQDGFGAAFGDYDLDGDLDLFVAGFTDFNAGSVLFQNNGDETFTNVTAAIGLWSGTPFNLRAFAPRFADMDGDRYPELLLAADFGTCRYLRNDGDGTFTDVTFSAGVGQAENGMGQSVGDFNNDGQFEWYVTSIYRPAIGWTGNKLYLNQGAHSYMHVAGAGVDDGGYGWGAINVDFDHDGRLDIAETNGDDSSLFNNEQSYLWMNNGDGTFTESALSMGLAHFGQGRSMMNFDYDNDGDQDVVILSNNQVSSLWENDLAGSQIGWLRVFLDTSGADDLAPDGYGAVVVASVGGQSQYRGLWGGDDFLCMSELSAHFGFGAATVVDELQVRWPNGEVTVLTDVPVNQTLTVKARPRGRLSGEPGGPLAPPPSGGAAPTPPGPGPVLSSGQ